MENHYGQATWSENMKILDKYIIGKFLGTFVFTILMFIMVAVVIDLVEHMDDFIDKEAPTNLIISEYYVNFIPHIIFLLFPLFVFIAVIFFTSQLASRSEIVATLAGGISFYRLLFGPYLFAAAILVALQLYANHYVVPDANKTRLDFESQYMKRRKIATNKNVHMQIAPNQFIYMESFVYKDSVGRKFTLEKLGDDGLVEKLSARRIEWKGKTQKWKLRNFVHRSINGLDENITTGVEKDTTFQFVPADLKSQVRLKEAMTRTELLSHIDKEKTRGAPNVEFYEVEHHKRSSVPFATFILTTIALAVASRKTRGGMGLHLFIGIAISCAYIIFMQFSTTFATNGNLSPLLSVWIPNIVFGLLAFILVLRAPK